MVTETYFRFSFHPIHNAIILSAILGISPKLQIGVKLFEKILTPKMAKMVGEHCA